jgi:hypothetical protein
VTVDNETLKWRKVRYRDDVSRGSTIHVLAGVQCIQENRRMEQQGNGVDRGTHCCGSEKAKEHVIADTHSSRISLLRGGKQEGHSGLNGR